MRSSLPTNYISGNFMEIIRALGSQMQETDFDGTGFTVEMDFIAVLRSSINSGL